MQKPTGCHKCGRPGHWAKDCPSSAPNSNPNSNSNPNPNPRPSNPNSSPYPFKNSSGAGPSKGKKVSAPKTRPKLTPEILLSDDGLGYILRHFPKAFKYRGRGHEVRDLGNLIGLYREWHSQLLPYYSFDQFVHKVEQVASTKRVKMTLRELRERAARGGDLTKVHEPPVIDEDDIAIDEQEPLIPEGPSDHQNDPSSGYHDEDFMPEDMLNEIYEKATEEPPLQCDTVTASISAPDSFQKDSAQLPNTNNDVGKSLENQLTEEQIARMEANRLKALEKAAARRRQLQVAVSAPDSSQKDSTPLPNSNNEAGRSTESGENQMTDEQIARMEASRLKALEKAAARRHQSQKRVMDSALSYSPEGSKPS